MMHGRYYARENLNGFQKVFFLFELRWKFLVDGEIGKLPLGRNFERLSHLKDKIGRPPGRMGPAVFKNRYLSRQRRITFRSTSINPIDDGLDLLRSQAPIIAECAIPPICTPRRHLPF